MTAPSVAAMQAALEVATLVRAYERQDETAGRAAMNAMLAGDARAVVGRLWTLARFVAKEGAATSKAATESWLTSDTPADYAAKILTAARDNDTMVLNLYAYKTTGQGGQFTVDVIGHLLRWHPREAK